MENINIIIIIVSKNWGVFFKPLKELAGMVV
jgi:hypothetical protein